MSFVKVPCLTMGLGLEEDVLLGPAGALFTEEEALEIELLGEAFGDAERGGEYLLTRLLACLRLEARVPRI